MHELGEGRDGEEGAELYSAGGLSYVRYGRKKQNRVQSCDWLKGGTAQSRKHFQRYITPHRMTNQDNSIVTLGFLSYNILIGVFYDVVEIIRSVFYVSRCWLEAVERTA